MQSDFPSGTTPLPPLRGINNVFQNSRNRPINPLVVQPERKPISQDHLVAEVKGIYAGLAMIEKKCVEVDTNLSQNSDQKLSADQWLALIALHRTLMSEHHDFFLAS